MNSFQLYKEHSKIEALYKKYPQSDGFIRYFTKSKINQIQNDLKSIIEKEIKKEQIKKEQIEKEHQIQNIIKSIFEEQLKKEQIEKEHQKKIELEKKNHTMFNLRKVYMQN